MNPNRWLIIVCLSFCFNICIAQQYYSNVDGTMVVNKEFSDIKGSAYSYGDWANGTVRLNNNQQYSNIGLKYSEYEDAVYFKGKNEEMLAFAVPVWDFTISYTYEDTKVIRHYRNGFKTFPEWNSNAYFEVLVDGKAQLLKKVVKKIEQRTEYGSTTTDKSFISITRYVLIINNQAKLISRDKKSLLAAFTDKQAELETYVKANNLNLKDEVDMAKLVMYYNSI